VTAAAVVGGGSGYAVGDQITLAIGPNTSPPIGAPAVLQVTSQSGGIITGVGIVPSIYGEDTPQTGAYFTPQTTPQAQGSTTGSGSGATFNLTFTSVAGPQRIITTNQEFATLNYIQDVTDPNIMDDLFQEAWVRVLGSGLVMSLTGDKKLANGLIAEANRMIEIARTPDGNEGLTINDYTPDWIRTRGIRFEGAYSGPYSNFDWGGSWSMWG
jgi:hypothetical protein